jgi:uncharacterized repeat protein (TIGR04052 family)
MQCTETGGGVQLTDLRLYVSDIKLGTQSGDFVDLQLDANGPWQQQDLALLDFEDGSGSCENGTAATNTALRGHAKPEDYLGLKFTVGVPFERNHADPLQAEAPLGDAAMHWHWRAGYKFLRAGIRTPEDGFWIHLGSTGCEGTVRNISACRFPNRVTVTLEDFVPGVDTVEIDLEALLASTALDDSVATDCSSGPAETTCEAPFRALGIPGVTAAGTSTQSVFRRRDPR